MQNLSGGTRFKCYPGPFSSVSYSADLFEVCLIGEDGEIRDKREDIYLDMLVSEVDELVEKTDDYEKRVSDTYNIIRY